MLFSKGITPKNYGRKLMVKKILIPLKYGRKVHMENLGRDKFKLKKISKY